MRRNRSLEKGVHVIEVIKEEEEDEEEEHDDEEEHDEDEGVDSRGPAKHRCLSC